MWTVKDPINANNQNFLYLPVGLNTGKGDIINGAIPGKTGGEEPTIGERLNPFGVWFVPVFCNFKCLKNYKEPIG